MPRIPLGAWSPEEEYIQQRFIPLNTSFIDPRLLYIAQHYAATGRKPDQAMIAQITLVRGYSSRMPEIQREKTINRADFGRIRTIQ